jgi:HD-GYP domain-containing protein (c-di-GMP phosphodiesterase class II)
METFSRVIFCTLHLRLPRCSRWQHTHVAKSEFDHMSEFDDLWKRIQGDSMPELLGEALEQSAPPKNHAGRVTALPTEETLVIARGAYLHDIGKMAIPHAILLKPAALTPEETAMMREHCLLGYKIVQKFPLLGGADEIVHSHHERYDGTGYPRRLKGEQIPLGARIVAVANTLDSITTNLPYRAAQSLDAAKAEIKRWSGHQFDPEIVRLFLQMPDDLWSEIVQSMHRQAPT